MNIKIAVVSAVLGLQSLWIVGTSLMQERALAHGKLVMLETRPVDPRDLLRGDYVILEYKINSIPWDKFSPALTNDLPPGQNVYVSLRRGEKFHEVDHASLTPIIAVEEAEKTAILRGVSTYSWRTPGTNMVRVEYGMERYYVSEGTGNPQGKLTVQASVPDSGHGLIKQVFIDNKPYSQAIREERQ